MENDTNNNQNHFRFIAAAALSLLVLFSWSFLTAPEPKPDDEAANTAVNANSNTAPAQSPTPETAEQTAATPEQPEPEAAPERKITIRSDLYEVVLDAKGAVATSWVLKQNMTNGTRAPIYADGSTPENQIPLQLISDHARNSTPRELPFRLRTKDENLNNILNDRNYTVSAESDVIELAAGEERSIEFTLSGANGLEAKKVFTFRADSYISDLAVDLKQNGQTVTDTRLLIGASIGDHAINFHTFYRIESEAVAQVDGNIVRHQGNYSFEYNAEKKSSISLPGNVNWAGVADAYFAMTAIPANIQSGGIEVTSQEYEVDIEPHYNSIYGWIIRSPHTTEKRHMVTSHMPIAADGSVNRVYTGTKDYYHLKDVNDELVKMTGREVDFVDTINFSNWSVVRLIVKPISIPILSALHFFNGLVGNYGWAIIIFTFLFYSLLFPLRWKQSRSFKKAAGNAPKMKELQDKLKDMQKKGIPNDDPRMRQLQMDQLKLTKDALPIGGCLPMLLQFPLLISFYTAITISLDARQASFAWINDLSAGDPWHLLEFGFAISMVLAMKFTPTGPAMTPEQKMQQKMMVYLMPVMMLLIMWSAPSGLLLYWFFGNIVSFGQQLIINNLNKTPEPQGTQMVESVPETAKKVKSKKK